VRRKPGGAEAGDAEKIPLGLRCLGAIHQRLEVGLNWQKCNGGDGVWRRGCNANCQNEKCKMQIVIGGLGTVESGTGVPHSQTLRHLVCPLAARRVGDVDSEGVALGPRLVQPLG
jgi:hypothetical protein